MLFSAPSNVPWNGCWGVPTEVSVGIIWKDPSVTVLPAKLSVPELTSSARPLSCSFVVSVKSFSEAEYHDVSTSVVDCGCATIIERWPAACIAVPPITVA